MYQPLKVSIFDAYALKTWERMNIKCKHFSAPNKVLAGAHQNLMVATCIHEELCFQQEEEHQDSTHLY